MADVDGKYVEYWRADFLEKHETSPEFETWWVVFYGPPERDFDPYDDEEMREYFVRKAFAWDGWCARVAVVGKTLSTPPVGGIAPPRRRHRLVVDIGADSPEEIVAAIREVERWATETGRVESLKTTGTLSVLGGPSYGWGILSEFRPDVTHESYFEAVEAWKERTP